MAFPNFLSHLIARRPKRDVFIGLLLFETFAVVHAFERTEGSLEVIKTKQFSYSQGFDKVLDQVDEVLYNFEKALSVRFKKVLFALPSSAVKAETKDVVAPYRSAVSEIVQNLELEAMGYIEMNDIVKSLGSTGETSLLIEVGKLKTPVMLSKNAQIVKQTVVVTNATNIATHVQELVTADTPIHIVSLCEGANMNVIVATLANYQVSLHTPEDIGLALHQLLRVQLLHQKTPSANDPAIDPAETLPTTQPVEHIEVATDRIDSLLIDAQQVSISTSEDFSLQYSSPDETNPSMIEGFAVFTPNVTNHRTDPLFTTQSTQQAPEQEVFETGDVVDHQPSTPEEKINSDETLDENVQTNVKQSFSRKRPLLIFVIASLLIGIVSLVIFEFTLHKVKITVVVPTEKFEWSDTLQNVPVTRLVEEEAVSLSVNATGTKEVGDPAKGTISLASFADEEVAFEQGTQVYFEDYAYTLDEKVIITPATIDIDTDTKQASKQQVGVTATFIGVQGNITKGNKMQVADFPSSLYYATTVDDFEGGSKQTVSVVTEADMKRLNSMVVAQTKKTTESAKKSTQEGVLVLDEISQINTSKLVYSKKAGDQSSNVKVEGTVLANLYTISSDDLINLIKEAVISDNKEGYTFSDDAISYDVETVTLSTDEKSVNIALSAALDIYPEIDANEVKKISRLTLTNTAKQQIKQSLNASDVLVSTSIYLPPFQYFIPYSLGNIDVFVEPVASQQ